MGRNHLPQGGKHEEAGAAGTGLIEKMQIDSIRYTRCIPRTILWSVLERVCTTHIPRYCDFAKENGLNYVVVQIDQSKFGKRKYGQRHHIEGVWVFKMDEKTPKRRINLVVVEERKAQTLTKIIEKLSK